MRQAFRNLSIQHKLTALIMLASSIVLLVASTAFVINEVISYQIAARQELAALADIIGANAAAALTFNDEKAAADTLAGLSANPHIMSAYIATKDGGVFATYLPRQKRGADAPARPKRYAELLQEAAEEPLWDLHPDLEVARDIVLDGQKLGKVLIQEDMDELAARLKWFLLVVVMIFCGAVYVAYLLSARLQGVISAPILHLAETMGAVSAGKNYALRARKTGNDELGKLIDGFNDMLEQLERHSNALTQNEEHLKNVLDSIHTGIMVINPLDHRIIEVNTYAAALIGGTKDKIVGRPCHDFICMGAKGLCPFEGALEEADDPERILTKFDGTQIPVLKSVVPVKFRDETLLIGSFVDISHLKEVEESLQGLNQKLSRSNEEYQEINEEIRNFAYIVSHDLRAPLVSIKGFSSELDSSIKEMQPLLNKCTAALDEKDHKRLDLILQEDIGEALGFIGSSVNRMDGLIGNILNLSRLGRMELKSEPVDMTEITKTILASLAHQIEQKRVTVTLAELPELVADKVSMEQIMGNLIDNALKYLEPERDGELSITADGAKGGVTFKVRDNGRGIAQDDMHKVFELFRRAGKQDTKGEGMGLAYVKTLVRRHGGRIWCESEPGVGSTFSFTVPLKINPSGYK